MKRFYFLYCSLFLGFLFSQLFAALPPLSDKAAQLEFVAAFPIEGPDNLAPSGLTILNSVLYAVSENHPNTIFKAVFDTRSVSFIPDQTFSIPKSYKKLQLEGITVDGYGQFYVLSKQYAKVFRVQSGELEWVPLNNFSVLAKKEGYFKNKGFFNRKKAGPEGLTLIRGNLFAIAAESKPRGIIITDHAKTSVHKVPNLIFHYKEDRTPDLSGLFYYKDQLWGLARNAESIVRLVYREGIYVEDFAYSFGHATFNQLYQYRNMRLGMAEGFAIDDTYIYIVINNKKQSRKISKDDKRPLLFIFKNPISKSIQ